jgi:hypothetical protein
MDDRAAFPPDRRHPERYVERKYEIIHDLRALMSHAAGVLRAALEGVLWMIVHLVPEIWDPELFHARKSVAVAEIKKIRRSF